jgi:uncharacterized damage-inducible protein DinB
MSSTEFRSIRPAPDEFLAYFATYVDLVPDGDIIQSLAMQRAETLALIRSLSEEQGDKRYAPDKWSIRELIGHVIDSERIFVYRALRFSRLDLANIEGFDEKDYAANGPYAHVTLADLGEEFNSVRRSTVHFFGNLDEKMMSSRGTAGDGQVSVRALAWITAGHEIHHCSILKTRYLNS